MYMNLPLLDGWLVHRQHFGAQSLCVQSVIHRCLAVVIIVGLGFRRIQLFVLPREEADLPVVN